MYPAILDAAGENKNEGGQAPSSTLSRDWSLVVGGGCEIVGDLEENNRQICAPLDAALRSSIRVLPNGRRVLQLRYPRHNNPSGVDLASAALTRYTIPMGKETACGSVSYEELLAGYSGKGRKKSKSRNGNVRNTTKEVVRSIIREQLSGMVGKTAAKAAIAGAGKMARSMKRKAKRNIVRKPNNMPNGDSGSNQRSAVNGNKIVLGKASNDWFNAYLNPFHPRVKGIGIPRPGSNPSYKVTGFVRGTGVIGLQGVGYVYGMPSLANDRACAGVTTAAYNALNLAQFSNSTSVILQTGNAHSPRSVYMQNLPYNSAAVVSNDVEARIVAVSLRMYYTGTELNRSGNYYCIVDPDFIDIIGSPHSDASAGNGWTADYMSTMDACEIIPVGKSNEARIVWVPPRPNLYDYPGATASNARKVYPFCENQLQFDSTTSGSCGAIMITGVPGETFYYEFIVHAEYFGRIVNNAALTASYSDIVGFDALSCAMARGVRAAASDRNGNLNRCMLQEVAREGIVAKKY